MELWRKVWREGVAPQLSDLALRQLWFALKEDNIRVQQQVVTIPPPLEAEAGAKCLAGCPIAFCGMAEGRKTVREVEDYFADICAGADRAMGEPASVRWFLNTIDDEWTRDQMRDNLLPEVELALEQRGKKVPAWPARNAARRWSGYTGIPWTPGPTRRHPRRPRQRGAKHARPRSNWNDKKPGRTAVRETHGRPHGEEPIPWLRRVDVQLRLRWEA